MPFIRHKQRAITAVSPVKGQGRWINPNKAKRILNHTQSAALAAQVKGEAGVPAGVTPGVVGSLGAIPGWGYTIPTPNNANVPIVITEEQDAIDLSLLATGGGGTGTLGDPYVILDSSRAFNNVVAIVQWNDPDSTYHCKIFESELLFNVGLGQQVIMNAGPTSWLFIDQSDFNNGNGSSSVPMVELNGGNVELTNILMDGARSGQGIVWKNSATSQVVVNNYEIGARAGNGITPGVLFKNTVAGGSISVNRLESVVHTNNPTGFEMQRDCVMSTTLTVINTEARMLTDLGLTTFFNSSNFLEHMVGPWSVSDSIIFGGNSQIIGTSGSASMTLSNFTLKTSDLSLRVAGKRMIDIGDSDGLSNPAAGRCSNWNVNWCRFIRPDSGVYGPGNEITYLRGFENLIFEYCWADGCNEDAYETYNPFGGNVFRYCGGDEIQQQMAEHFTGAAGGPYPGNKIHDIWGTCGGEGALLTDIGDCELWNIFTDSSAIQRSPVTLRPALANIVLDAREATPQQQVNGNKTFGGITNVAGSAPNNPPQPGTPYLEFEDLGTMGTNTNTATLEPAITP